MDDQTRKHYRRLRTAYPTMPVIQTLRWARWEVKVDALEDEAEWDYRAGDGHVLEVARFDGFSIRVYVDDEPYDWGDIEPTEQEARDLQVIGVGLRFDGADSDHESVWGIAYTSYDHEREGLSAALEFGYIDLGRAETPEREAMECRGVVTV